MPARKDIHSIAVVGSGPIVIGQACEFDYSGTQACRALKAEGYRVVLLNSNPATIMTDPELVDATYVEPLDPEVLAKVLEKERPDALLPTLGGQTALNLSLAVHDAGILDELGVELIGANAEAIRTAEDRDRFREAMVGIGLSVPEGGFAHELTEAMSMAERVGYPVMVRPSFILGGTGTGIAHDPEELVRVVSAGLSASPVGEVLVERSVLGFKEYELEVMRDRNDNCVVICSIENMDPMGVHTGDSITVAPAQTLSDPEYQAMRDAAFKCIRRVGVETGGSNIQFALDPETGEQLVIEMNPRVSRSSALASKATGFPIAKIAAKLAVGYTLEEIPNDITKATPSSFEPTIDYVVTKVPRWAFEKLPGTSGVLGTQMQSVGEVMAIGRTFQESLQKALRGLEEGHLGLNAGPHEASYDVLSNEELLAKIASPTPWRVFQIEAALRRGLTVDQVYQACKVDRWFLHQIQDLVTLREELQQSSTPGVPPALEPSEWRKAKLAGFSDAQLAYLWGVKEADVASARKAAGVRRTYKTVDTCAAEFEAFTPYHYSTFEEEDEKRLTSGRRVVILGSGPNRIGQGIEFDYCCVHASLSLHQAGYETVMINCNPETVSTDYDTSDRLYFEPLTLEDVTAVLERERNGGPLAGVIVGLGGQTPLKLAGALGSDLVAGTSPEAIDLAEDRGRWSALLAQLSLSQPPGGTASRIGEALAVASEIGYPVLVRPSYVLGGRAMQVVDGPEQMRAALEAMGLSDDGFQGSKGSSELTAKPVLVDRFLENAIEVDVDALRDQSGEVLIAGVMEHVEHAGVHSGDSACALPPQSLPREVIEELEDATKAIAQALDVKGPLNVQYAVQSGKVYVLEANPRASRTLPFVAKATGLPIAKAAARLMLGSTLEELRFEGVLPAWSKGLTWTEKARFPYVAVKEAVLPFARFSGVDTILGPEMRSTGEVMGVDLSFGMAFAKSQMAAGNPLPVAGSGAGMVLMSLADKDKPEGAEIARRLSGLGFELAATQGTAKFLRGSGLKVAVEVAKIGEPDAPGRQDVVSLIESGKVSLVVNTPRGSGPRVDGVHIRLAALSKRVSCLTTLAAAKAAVEGIAAWQDSSLAVRSLQELHAT
jgi:carbamoyl-phosphate synthase large subunit